MTEIYPKTSFWHDIVKPATIGILGGIIVALLFPDFVIQSFGAEGATNSFSFAWTRMTARLSALANGDFSDSVAWGAILFGAILGVFLKFVSDD